MYFVMIGIKFVYSYQSFSVGDMGKRSTGIFRLYLSRTKRMENNNVLVFLPICSLELTRFYHTGISRSSGSGFRDVSVYTNVLYVLRRIYAMLSIL